MNKHARCRLITNYMSTWLYSTGRPPEPINQIYLHWISTGKVPSKKTIEGAIERSERVGNANNARMQREEIFHSEEKRVDGNEADDKSA